jgi:hypothetical protein
MYIFVTNNINYMYENLSSKYSFYFIIKIPFMITFFWYLVFIFNSLKGILSMEFNIIFKKK